MKELRMPVGVDPIIGTTLGSFRVTRALGRGGMGSVYLGEHTVIGSKVAIKVLHEKLSSDENLVARFYAEARAVNLIGHENIVSIFDMNLVPPNRFYLIMEYLEGKQLNMLLTRAVTPEVAIPILTQVCEALTAAHKASIIHRDLKPENIFLTRRGKVDNFVKVLDFGLAKLLDNDLAPQQTSAGLIVGTPEFMSPEQANSTPVDGRSDIYSLGCIAWLLATGRLPFPQRGLTDLLVAHRQQMPAPPHEVNPAVPKVWSEAIMKAMAKRPGDRFQAAKDFSDAMERCLKPSTTTTAAHSPALGVPAAAAAPSPRHEARFSAEVAGLDGKAYGKVECKDLSKGGMFLCGAMPYPPLFSRIKITIATEAKVTLLGEVVRHIPPDQAKAWGMSPGFGIQFLDVTPPLKEALERLLKGLPLQAAPATANQSADKSADPILARYRDRVQGDHYMLLGAPADLDFGELRVKGREAIRELETFRNRPLSDGQRSQLEAALARIKSAIEVIGAPLPRAEYDAHRGNFRGVARSISSGLPMADLEKLRTAHLAAHPGAAGSAHVRLVASKAYEQRQEWRQAVEETENALTIDPLNVALHQRYAQLIRKMREAVKPPV